MSFFSSKVINIDPKEKIKEGFLKKESRYRKVWRERWVVLTTKFIYTFEKANKYVNPTETIDINNVITVKTDPLKNGNVFVRIKLYDI